MIHKKGKKHKRVLFLIVIPLLLMILFILYNNIDTVNVTGCEYYTEEEIKNEVIRSIFDRNSFLLYLKSRYFGIREIPYIEKVTIKRENRHEVTIRVYEKSLVACVKYMGQYLYFDKDGVILDASSKQIEQIPCISGLNFSTFCIYEKLEVEEDDIFNSILDLSQLIRRYKLNIDKIHFNNKKEVTLISGEIRIYLGKREFFDEPLVALSEILKEAEKEKLKGSIDMTDYTSGDKVIFERQ